MTHEKKLSLLIIVVDDLGFSDAGLYGSEIPAPTLAKEGIVMTGLHTASACSPMRAILMLGTAGNHIAGLGQMAGYMKTICST